MVRLKTRWLLVRIDVPATVTTEATTMLHDDELPSRKELSSAIRQNLSHHLGIAGEGPAYDTQVRFWDPISRLLLIRVLRSDCGLVRASLTLWTHTLFDHKRIVASVLSVNGSARTAKRATLLHIRKWYRNRLLLQQQEQHEAQQQGQKKQKSSYNATSSNTQKHSTTSKSVTTFKRKELDKLQELITTIQNID